MLSIQLVMLDYLVALLHSYVIVDSLNLFGILSPNSTLHRIFPDSFTTELNINITS